MPGRALPVRPRVHALAAAVHPVEVEHGGHCAGGYGHADTDNGGQGDAPLVHLGLSRHLLAALRHEPLLLPEQLV